MFITIVVALSIIVTVLLLSVILSYYSNRSEVLQYDTELKKIKHVCSQCQSHKCNDCVWHNKTYF